MFTERGLKYNKDIRKKKCTSARKKVLLLMDTIKLSMEDEDKETVQGEYKSWLRAYETFLVTSEEYKCMLEVEEGEQCVFIEDFISANDEFLKFKDLIETSLLKWNSTTSLNMSEIGDIQAHVSASQVSHRSFGSKVSMVSNLRIKVEQDKAGLAAQVSALQEKHELELIRRRLEKDKLYLSQREEKLNLKTKYEIADDRSRVLDQFESQSDISKYNPSSKYPFIDKTVMPIARPVHVSVADPKDLNPDAHKFVPDTSTHAFNPVRGRGIIQTDTSSSDGAILAVARELRKPASDIQKFSGNPMDYKRFMRQFSASVVAYTDTYEERLNYLDQYTVGDPHKVVIGYSHLDGAVGYAAAMKELKARYGDPEIIASAYIKRALEWPVIKADNVKALDDFGVFLMECQHAVQNIAANVLEYTDNLRRLVAKLPFFLHDRWRNIVMNTKEQGQVVKFDQLVELVCREARKAMDPMYGRDSISGVLPHQTVKQGPPKFVRAKGFATNVSESTSSPKLNANMSRKSCLNCNGEHGIQDCNKLKAESHETKIEILKSKGLCFGCLSYGHRSRDCKKRLTCTVCSKFHPSVLHKPQTDSVAIGFEHRAGVPSGSRPNGNMLSATNTCCGHTGAGDTRNLAMSILPVKVMVKGAPSDRYIETYALLDSGSTATFCSESVMKSLNVTGHKTKVLLKTMGQEKLVDSYVIKNLEVCSLSGDETVALPPVLSQVNLPVSKKDIVYENDLKAWSYLQGVSLPRINSDIGLLIGINAPKAMEPYEVIPSEGNGPFAVRTNLGWVINGPLNTSSADSESNNYVSVLVNRMDIAHEPTLQDQLINQFNYDFSERQIDDVHEYSQNDKKFIESLSRSIEYKDGHYSIGLPFKDKQVCMPNNRKQAEQRLTMLGRRFQRDKAFHEDYTAFMGNVLQKGYAREVPSDEVATQNGNVWYLPHHGVYHPRKNKVRVVFDCAARFGGTSLNDLLLAGPNLANTLVGTLLRFRQGNVAVLSDIESMFYQVSIPIKDANFLRFLWWKDGDVEHPIVEYQMLVHLFGATSSPGCAIFALLQTAQDNEEMFGTEVAEILRHNFYIDDCLKSIDKPDEAVILYDNLRGICDKGGFNLTKWMSNNRKVVDHIPDSERASGAKNLDLDQESLPIERTLGVQWNAETDVFEFNIEIKDKPVTCRGILAITSSVFDPLGFLAPFILRAKCLLQELCSLGLGWDDKLPKYMEQRWNQWLEDVKLLTDFKINRCVKPPDFGDIKCAELHHFSDASEDGYGVASYLRLVNAQGEKHCGLLNGKARVAPLKRVTIPRLELTAATVAVKTDRMLSRELDIKIDNSYFWTDSMSVLRYVRNESSRLQTFVANRVATIREGSNVSQWRYINTKLNPGDEASRGQSAEELLRNTRWIEGPSFLELDVCEWPVNTEAYAEDLNDDPEVKKVVSALVTQSVESDENGDISNSVDKLIKYHSSWFNLKRSVAWILRMKKALLQRVRIKKVTNCGSLATGLDDSVLTVHDMDMAEKALIKHTQSSVYSDEMRTLQDGVSSCVKKNSAIRKLDPMLDDGLLRVGGRLSRANLPEESKHPIILPKDHHVSLLILRDVHVNLMHDGRNHMLSKVRQRFWIINATAAIRRVINNCVVCRKQRSRVGEQKMSNLPRDRLIADEPPFTYTGVDYFGPFKVKRGRSVVKRYGVLFTCLTIRAVHLEVADSMDTSSYISALRRFIARRGMVKRLRSDNGSHFIGAERELKDAINHWNVKQIQNSMLQRNVEWFFNPPSGSHHGGVWERMIRTVRKVLNSVVKEQTLDDEGFRTLFCEIEAILNDRPITRVPDQPNDLEALTPNHLLLLKLYPSLPPGVFSKEDTYSRRRWRQVQYMADVFWKRWIREYLPLLQERQKWFAVRRNLQVGDIVLVDYGSGRQSSKEFMAFGKGRRSDSG